MSIATINRTILWFDEAFQALSLPVPMVEVERLAMLVHHSMDAKARVFHTTRHVFIMGNGMKPLQRLAALFHDVVYYQLDGGFPERVAHLLDGLTRTENGDLILQEIKPGDRAAALCLDIFDFHPGQVLPLYRGLNEFLSAVVAARLLQPHLPEAHLIAVVACIEATVPFRAPDALGRTAAQDLAQRIQARCTKFRSELGLAEDEIAPFVKNVVTDAVTLANRDVAGFAEADPVQCLSNTLLLIEESNAPLAAVGVYSLREYRGALQRMEGFLSGLDPAVVCQSYDGHPSADALRDMTAITRRNIEFSCHYLGAILTSISIVEALALCTGSDCPIAMFLGDISSSDGRPDRVEDFLPEPPSGQRTEPEMLKVLAEGRSLESVNDLTASPLTTFIYRWLGHEGMRQTLQRAKGMFDEDMSPHAFLKTLDRAMLHAIIGACAKIALSRREALLALENTL